MTNTRNRQYIGVTGIGDYNDVEPLVRAHTKIKSPHDLMIGGLVSDKTPEIEFSRNSHILSIDNLAEIMVKLKLLKAQDVLFALHYHPTCEKEIEGQSYELELDYVDQIVSRLYNMHHNSDHPYQLGLQINLSWPNPDEVRRIQEQYPDLRIILQVSDFQSIEERIGEYTVDHVLLDTSRGSGKRFDPRETAAAYRAVHPNAPGTSIGVAGGLTPDNVKERIGELRKNLGWPFFSIDAEKGLYSNDHFDADDKGATFIKRAGKVLELKE